MGWASPSHFIVVGGKEPRLLVTEVYQDWKAKEGTKFHKSTHSHLCHIFKEIILRVTI